MGDAVTQSESHDQQATSQDSSLPLLPYIRAIGVSPHGPRLEFKANHRCRTWLWLHTRVT